ncbi:MAG TPA: hypothetical protein VFD84_10440 [Candidatus Binatia bacterium]|nr:hypothetical protein [Candidatus Binatia bacterium]
MIARVSNSQAFTLLSQRAGELELSLRRLQEEIATGRRITSPDQDPAGANEIIRSQSNLAALAQYRSTSTFGVTVLGAVDQALSEAQNLMVRAEEVATQQASGLLSDAERVAAREEVHGILQALTSLGNTEFAGRRIFAGLALNAAPPFADPDSPGYDPANAYSGSTVEFEVKIGGGANERVRITTRGDQVFTDALVGVAALENALATNGDVRATIAGLAQGRETLSAERASVGARQAQLVDRASQVADAKAAEESNLARAQDADLTLVLSQLAQAQTALQATLQAGAKVIQTSLANLLNL